MRCKGFSIIELLVVIGVLAVLVNLGLVVGRRAREMGRSTRCMANQRQLYLALLAYGEDFDCLPFAMEFSLSPGSKELAGHRALDPTRKWWFQGILKHTVDNWCEPLLECPSTNFKADSVVGQSNVLCGNYGVNCSLLLFDQNGEDPAFYREFFGKPRSLNRLKRGAQTLLLCDSGYSLVSWRHATASPFDNSSLADQTGIRREFRSYIPGLSTNALRTDIYSPMQADAVDGRHFNQSINVTFADGHIDRMAAEELRVDGDPNHYINKTPLWVPE